MSDNENRTPETPHQGPAPQGPPPAPTGYVPHSTPWQSPSPLGYPGAPPSGHYASQPHPHSGVHGPSQPSGVWQPTSSSVPGPGITSPLESQTARRSGRTRSGVIVAAALALMIGSGATGAVISQSLDGNSSRVVTASPVAVEGVSREAGSLSDVAAAVSPSVVSIVSTTNSGVSEGSGIILTSDGTILTNNHVVAGAPRTGGIEVRLNDGSSYSANVVGADASSDLAVIRLVNASDLTPATLGNSDKLKVGDTVLAVGSPLGLEGSVSAGIVSALHRSVNLGTAPGATESSLLADAIQTDAAVNPGNSGGPLVDASGAVVGINTAIATAGGEASGNIGVGFSIPIDYASRIAKDLAEGKTPQRAILGVETRASSSGGAEVANVTSGSGADKAGIRPGDVVLSVDGRLVESPSDLVAAVRSRAPGEKVEIALDRSGDKSTVEVTLGSSEDN